MRNTAKKLLVASALFAAAAGAYPARARAGLPRVLWQISGNCSWAIIVNHLHAASEKLSTFAHAVGWNIPANPLGPAGIGPGLRQGGSAAMVFFRLPKSLQAARDPWVLILPTSNSHLVLNQLHAGRPNRNVSKISLPGGAGGYVANFGSFIAITQYHRLMDIYMANRGRPLINVLPPAARNRLQHCDAAWYISPPVVAQAAQYPVGLWVNHFYNKAWQTFMRRHPKKNAQAVERRVLGLAAHDLHVRANTLLQQCMATLVCVRFENGGVQLQATVATKPHGDLSRLGKSLPALPVKTLATLPAALASQAPRAAPAVKSATSKPVKLWWDPMIGPSSIRNAPGRSAMGMALVRYYGKPPAARAKPAPGLHQTYHPVMVATSNVHTLLLVRFIRRQIVKAFWQRPVDFPAFRTFRKQCSAALSKRLHAIDAFYQKQGVGRSVVYSSRHTPGPRGLVSVQVIRTAHPRHLGNYLIKQHLKMPLSRGLFAALAPWFHANWLHTVSVGGATHVKAFMVTTLSSTLQPWAAVYLHRLLHNKKTMATARAAFRILRARYAGGMKTYIAVGKTSVLVVKNLPTPPPDFATFFKTTPSRDKPGKARAGNALFTKEFLPHASAAAVFYPAAIMQRLHIAAARKAKPGSRPARRVGAPAIASVFGNPHRITLRVFVRNTQLRLLRQLWLKWRQARH